MRISARPAAVVAGLVATAALAATAIAGAASTTYTSTTLTQSAAAGLPVSGPLTGFKAVSHARLVVSDAWRPIHAPAATLRYVVRADSRCTYNVRVLILSRIAPDVAPADFVASDLPSPGRNRLLDAGTRLASAFRLTRPTSADGTILLKGEWASVLTRRDDIAPAGKVVWSVLAVDAQSRPGDECHSGTYRSNLGPQIADMLSTARAGLHFIGRKG